MTDDNMIQERFDRLEDQIAPLVESARAVTELRDELAPRVNEAVQALIIQLADVEADFQLEDLIFLVKKLLRNVKNLNLTLDMLKILIDFAVNAEPLLKDTVPRMIFYLDDLEQKGVFRLVSAGINVLERIGTSLSQEDLQQLGDGLVRLVAIFKKLTTPEALDLLDKAAALPARVDLSNAPPIGKWGLLRALGDPETKAGMGVALAFTRSLAELKT